MARVLAKKSSPVFVRVVIAVVSEFVYEGFDNEARVRVAHRPPEPNRYRKVHSFVRHEHMGYGVRLVGCSFR